MTNTTLKNLEYTAQREKKEKMVLYLENQRKAKEEGYIEDENCFKEIIEVEKVHKKRYIDLIKNIKEDKKKEKNTSTTEKRKLESTVEGLLWKFK